MTRLLFAFGMAGALGLFLSGGLGGTPGYFAAWLFWIGLPMGALPLVMAMEATAATRSPLLPILRATLPLLPLGLLFAVPLAGGLPALFARPGPGALPAWWTAPGTLALRDGALLLVLSVLAMVFFTRTARPRRGAAAAGLLVHLFVATVLAVDLVLAPQPALASSLAGLLLIAGQTTLAAAFAALVLAVGTAPGARLADGTGLLVGLVTGFWFFLQFAQFLVIWSANLPSEAAWYLARLAEGGTAAIAFVAIAALASIALLPSGLGRLPVAMATLAAMLVLALLLTTLLFVLPAFRGQLALNTGDGLAIIGLGGLLVGALSLLMRREPRHGLA